MRTVSDLLWVVERLSEYDEEAGRYVAASPSIYISAG